MRKLCLLLVAIAIASACSDTILVEESNPELRNAISEYPKLASGGVMPIVGWGAILQEEISYESMQQMADAGFTHHLGGAYLRDSIGKLLDIANATPVTGGNGTERMKVIIPWNDILKSHVTDVLFEEVINEFKGHPATAGFYLTDEPWPDQFSWIMPLLTRLSVKLDALLPNDQIIHVNMLPNWADVFNPDSAAYLMPYSDYVDEITNLPTRVISFDHYPIIRVGSNIILRPQYYKNLEVISAKSRNTGEPFWGFALATAHTDNPTPTLGYLRFQMYSSLAYGAQGLQYFTYCKPREGNFYLAPVEWDQTLEAFIPTATYYTVQAMNQEIKARTGVFLGSEVLSVKHTGSDSIRPSGTIKYTRTSSHPYIKNVQHFILNDDGVIVSELRNGNNRFLVIVNRSIKKNINLDITFSRSSSIKQILNDGSIIPAGNEGGVTSTVILNKTVEPGDALIYMYPDF